MLAAEFLLVFLIQDQFMPFVRFTNQTPLRTVKHDYIWLDYIEFVKGDCANVLIIIRDTKYVNVKKISLTQPTNKKAEANGRYDFNQNESLALIKFNQISKYVIEIEDISDRNQLFDIKLFYK